MGGGGAVNATEGAVAGPRAVGLKVTGEREAPGPAQLPVIRGRAGEAASVRVTGETVEWTDQAGCGRGGHHVPFPTL